MKNIEIEIRNDEITQRGIHSIVDFYRTMAISELKLSHAVGFATGVYSPFLNVFFDFRSDRSDSKEMMMQASDFFHQMNLPWGWFIFPASFDNDLVQAGFTLLTEAPAMYYDLSLDLPEMTAPYIRIEEVKDDLKSWADPVDEAFEAKEGDDCYRILNAALIQKSETKLRHYIAYYKEELAAAGTLFLSENSVMVHNVATKTNFRKRGLATALTLHMMKIAKEHGYKHCYLDASEEAFHLYQRIGFKVYATTLVYAKES